MGDIGALLYAAGASLVLLSIGLPGWRDLDPIGLSLIALVAYVVAGGLAASVRLLDVPRAVFPVLNALGSLLVGLVVVRGGSGLYGVLYVFVAAYGFYYFTPKVAAAELVLAAAVYGTALTFIDGRDAVAEWTLITATAGIGGGLIGSLGNRTRTMLEAEVEATERLRELDDLKSGFVSAVSHELRTPLTNLHGYATTLSRHIEKIDSDQQRLILERLTWNADRLLTLLTDLLDLDRLSRGIVTLRAAPTDLADVVRDVMNNIDVGAHPLTFDVVSVVVPVDRAKVERILENLVANAAKHTPATTPITVRVQPSVGGGAMLVVEDEGPGVPPDLRDQIFEPFRQGPEALGMPSPGTGIGLSLAQRYAHLHGGRIWAEDRAGGGARFCVLIPGDA